MYFPFSVKVFSKVSVPVGYKAAELLAEFLPIEPTEGHQTVRKRTLTLGARLEDQSLRQVRESPPLACEHKQLELGLPDDLLREFVVSIDTAHIRSADQKTARDFEIVIARCGRGGRRMPPGHYFATSNTSQLEMRARTLQALQFEGYSGHGEVTILSDGAEIMKPALPLQVDFKLNCLASCKHLSGVTREGRGAQMGNPLAHASTGGRPLGSR